MLKLIGIIVAAMPVILFLRAMFMGSKRRSQAVSNFKKQVDYAVWAILFMIGCGVAFSIGKLIYDMPSMTQVVTNSRPSPRYRPYPIRVNPSYKVGICALFAQIPGEGASPRVGASWRGTFAPTSPPLWRGPSPRPSPRKRGEGAERPAHALMLAPIGVAPTSSLRRHESSVAARVNAHRRQAAGSRREALRPCSA